MKRSLFAAQFSLLLVLVLSACTGPSASADNDGCLGSAQSAIVDLNCRKVTIAVENVYLPFNYISIETGKPGGWDYDTWNEICTRLHCTPEFVETGWDGMIQAVADGQFDVGADGITITADRLKQVDFSDGYIQIEQKLLVRNGEDRFDSMQALVDNINLLLAVQSNTSNYETATQYLPETRINAFEQMPFAVQAVIAGDADAVLIDAIVGMGYMGQSSNQLALLGEAISSDELGFAFKKGSDLVIPVNRALESMRADGSLKTLNEKYFGPAFKLTENDIQTGE